MAFSTTLRIRPAPPRGIRTSIYLFCFISSAALSLSVLSIRVSTSFGSTSETAARSEFIMAVFDFMASLPPFNITAFPVLIHNAAASAVTFGRAS